MPSEPGRAFEVTLATSEASVTVRADRFRADLQRAGLSEGCYGFSVSTSELPLYRFGVTCTWTDLGLPLPGSPWSAPVSPGATFVRGKVRLRVDTPLLGDKRLTGYAFDIAQPLLRIRMGAVCAGEVRDTAVASLYRSQDADDIGDGYHGFILSLPAPLRMIEGGVRLVDVDRDEVLAQLGPKTF